MSALPHQAPEPNHRHFLELLYQQLVDKLGIRGATALRLPAESNHIIYNAAEQPSQGFTFSEAALLQSSDQAYAIAIGDAKFRNQTWLAELVLIQTGVTDPSLAPARISHLLRSNRRHGIVAFYLLRDGQIGSPHALLRDAILRSIPAATLTLNMDRLATLTGLHLKELQKPV